MQGHVPTDLLTGFEKTAMTSAGNCFIGTIIKGCLFHLVSNIWKNIQDSGRKMLFLGDDEFSTLMRMIAAVAFVPNVDIPQTFYDLEVEIRTYYNENGIDVVLDYFEDTYIGCQRRGRPRDIPMFPIDIWGVYDRTVNRYLGQTIISKHGINGLI